MVDSTIPIIAVDKFVSIPRAAEIVYVNGSSTYSKFSATITHIIEPICDGSEE